jgi:hypothetical protein
MTPTTAAAVAAQPFTIAADGSYAARLACDPEWGGNAWFPERWTLDGHEPYAVPLPLGQPEEPDTEVLPLTDGRVLVSRRIAERFQFSLLYPTDPGTGELPLGAVESAEMVLLPPCPDGLTAYALAPGGDTTGVWLVAGGAFGPELVAEVPGRCSGGAWLDRAGGMLAVDREADGVVKAVAVDLGRGGGTTPLLQIARDSNDRLLLADQDSGLLLIRSDAPGQDRLGWGVLGSTRPVRFPECLLPGEGEHALTPFAVQPGQVLTPESCGVALRVEGPGGPHAGSLAMWRPSARRLHVVPAPAGWLVGAGLWTREGVLRLPYAGRGAPCGLADVRAAFEDAAEQGERAEQAGSPEEADRAPGVPGRTDTLPGSCGDAAGQAEAPHTGPAGPGTDIESQRTDRRSPEPHTPPRTPVLCKPVPLQQAPLQQAAPVQWVSISGQGALG